MSVYVLNPEQAVQMKHYGGCQVATYHNEHTDSRERSVDIGYDGTYFIVNCRATDEERPGYLVTVDMHHVEDEEEARELAEVWCNG